MNGLCAMAAREPAVPPTGNVSAEVRPLFIATWKDALFLHFEMDPRRLQASLPFEVDQWHGRAFVSLVAFTMQGMRFARGGACGAWLCRPIATHPFLNLRTYVRVGDHAAICFLAEWLPNWLSLLCGPWLYSLPYRHATIQYHRKERFLRGQVAKRSGSFVYRGTLGGGPFTECLPGSLDEFLLERYTACNAGYLLSNAAVPTRVFHVRHAPWLQRGATVDIMDDSLLRQAAPWWTEAQFVGAHFSPGVSDVGMSAPRHSIASP